MSKQEKLPFKVEVAGLEAITLIPVGKYVGTIEAAKFVEMPNNETKLWIGVRITGPKQANRYITTLLTLDDKAASAYKTASLIKALAKQFGEAMLPAEAERLNGKFIGIDVVHWTPRNTGETTAEIRSFYESNRVANLVADLAGDLDMNKKLNDNEPAF